MLAVETLVKVLIRITFAGVLLWVQLLSKSLDQVKGESWFAECGDAFIKHIPLYARIPDEKVSILHWDNALWYKYIKDVRFPLYVAMALIFTWFCFVSWNIKPSWDLNRSLIWHILHCCTFDILFSINYNCYFNENTENNDDNYGTVS